MKMTVRNGCFETNSSSMHSIVVTKEQGNSNLLEYDTDYQIKDYPVRDEEIEFGRYPFQVLGSIKDKARYAIASAGNDQKKIQQIIDLVKKLTGCELKVKKTRVAKYRNAETKEEIPSWNISWIDDPEDPNGEICCLEDEINLPVENMTEIEWTEYDEWQGYVDHESAGLLDGFLNKEGITLEEFLTKKKYIVIIDGDEYCDFENMIRTGLINTDNIDHRFPKGGSYDTYLWRMNNEENN